MTLLLAIKLYFILSALATLCWIHLPAEGEE